MNRREFLKYVTVLGASATLGKTSAYANWLTNKKRGGFPQGMLLIDAHAHPDQLYYMGLREGPQWETWCSQYCDDSSTLEKIKQIGMHGSGFAAIGDTKNTGLNWEQAMSQMEKVIDLENKGLVRIIRRHKDMPRGAPPKGYIPGAILSLEGAFSLGENEETIFTNLENFYRIGGRMITLMHYRDNHFGYAMRSGQVNNDDTGVTHLGEIAVERMMELGIIVDVAHAHYYTLKDIKDIAVANNIPLIDSHTSLSSCEELCGGRLRIWEEMEMVAETGGMVCTWPLSWVSPTYNLSRQSILDWAKENLEIAREIGFEHIGLGTDGGGGLPELVDGYTSILDLPKLVVAMDEVGFKRSEIEAYMGGNLLRVIKKCIG